MDSFVQSIKELLTELKQIGPMGVAALALLVALSALWVLGATL